MAAVRLVFLGPPGSGKGTQARRASERFGLIAISSGEVLRGEIRRATEIGQQARSYVESGALVPDEVITAMMLGAIDSLHGAGFVFDGFPRTVPQAEALEAGLGERGAPLDAAIDFRVDDGQIIARLADRRVCKDCGATYNMRFLPPRRADRCDACGGEIEQRSDDRADVIARRLEAYRSQTAPLIEFYSDRSQLRCVDADRSAAEVESSVTAIVEELGAGR